MHKHEANSASYPRWSEKRVPVRGAAAVLFGWECNHTSDTILAMHHRFLKYIYILLYTGVGPRNYAVDRLRRAGKYSWTINAH